MSKAVWRRWAAWGAPALLVMAGLATAARAADTDTRTNAWMGVYTQSLTDELREGISYKGDGVLVASVVPGGPAEKAGLKKGDVITTYNSKKVDSPEALSRLVGQTKVGQEVAIGIARGATPSTVKLKLGDRGDAEDLIPRSRMRMDMPGMPPEVPMPPMVMMGSGQGRLGVRVEALNKDLGSYFSVPDGKGVLVVEVLSDTPAEKAGLKAGDVITKVRDRSVYEPDDLVSALRSEDAGKVPLTVVRKGKTQTFQPELEKSESHTYMFHRGQGPMGFRHWSTDGDDRDQQIRDLQRQLDDLKREMQKLQHD